VTLDSSFKVTLAFMWIICFGKARMRGGRRLMRYCRLEERDVPWARR
jgi:hypothetical protein